MLSESRAKEAAERRAAVRKVKQEQKLWEILKSGRYEVCISNIVMNEIYECSEEKLHILLEYLNQIDYTMVIVDEDMLIYQPSALAEEDEDDYE